MNDKKFDALRKKLDGMGLPQTLHPDSIELVDKLYNKLYKCLNDLVEKENKIKLMGTSNTNDSILNDRIESLTLQRDSLRKQLDETKSGLPQRQSDERIRNLTTLVNNFRVKQEDSTLQYQREVKKLSSEVASLELRNSQLQRENNQLRGTNAQSYNQFEKQAAELASLVERKGKEIRELEDTNSKLRIRVQVLEKSIEENKFTGKEMQKQGKSQSDRFQSIMKQELADSQAKCRQLKTEVDLVREDNENLKRQYRKLRQQLILMRNQENSSRNLQSIDRSSRQKAGQMYEQVRQQLQQKMEEVKKLRDCLDENENQSSRLEAKVKELSNKNKFLSDKNADLQSEIQLISTKSTLNVKRVRELEATNLSLEKQLKENLSQGGGGPQQIVKELRQQQMKCEQLRRQTVIKQREIKLLEQQLRVLKEQSEQRAVERDRTQLQLKKLQTIMADGSRNLQALQLQKEQLMKENRQLRTGKQMLSSADSAAKSELFLLKEKLQGTQARIDELESILNSERVHKKQLEAEIARMNTGMLRSQEKNRQIFDDNRLMAGQIKILQDRKNELHEKVKELQQRAHVQLEGSSINRRELDELITKNEELAAQLGRKDQALRRIDAEKDQLQNELDRQTEEKAQLKDQLIVLQRDIRQYSRGIEEGQQGLGQLQRKLSRSESVREQLQRQYERLVEEDAVLRDRLSAAEASLRELNNEVALLVASKSEQQRQAARSKNKIAQLDRRLRDCKNEADQQRQRASAMNILSSQLQGEVERERAEVVRLRGFVGQLEQANNHMYQLLQGKDHDIDELGRALEETERREEQYIHEINSYQRQLENLSQDLDMAQEDARRAHGEREVLRAERNWKKDVSSLTQDWRTKQEERFVEVQQDYQKCKNECDQLRHRCRELEEMLSEERVRSHRLAQQSNLGTPTSQVALVESRVESYVQNQNFNNSNVYARARNLSLQHIADNLNQSEESQSQSVKSAKLSLMEIERKYMQTLMPNSRPGLKL